MARQKQDGLHTDVGQSAVDLKGKEMHFCTRRADGKIELTGAGGYADGVISEGMPAGKHTSFNTPGNPILRVKAGSALARNALVVSDAEGRAVAGTTNVFGKVRNPVNAANEIVEVVPGRIADAVDDVV
jgi:hypothetical protein